MSMIFILIKIKFIKFIINFVLLLHCCFTISLTMEIMKKNEFDFVKIKLHLNEKYRMILKNIECKLN